MAAEIMLLAVLLWASYTGACRKHREDRLKRERVRKYLEKRRLAVFLRTIRYDRERRRTIKRRTRRSATLWHVGFEINSCFTIYVLQEEAVGLGMVQLSGCPPALNLDSA